MEAIRSVAPVPVAEPPVAPRSTATTQDIDEYYRKEKLRKLHELQRRRGKEQRRVVRRQLLESKLPFGASEACEALRRGGANCKFRRRKARDVNKAWKVLVRTGERSQEGRRSVYRTFIETRHEKR